MSLQNLCCPSIDPHFIFLWAAKQMSKGFLHVSSEAGGEDIFLSSELMPRLPDDGIDDIQAGDLVFRPALEDELLDVLHDVLVELDGFHRWLCDRAHLRLWYRNLVVVERKELKIERGFIRFLHFTRWISSQRFRYRHNVSLILIAAESAQLSAQ